MASFWCEDQVRRRLPAAVPLSGLNKVLMLGLTHPENQPDWVLSGKHAAAAMAFPSAPSPMFHTRSMCQARHRPAGQAGARRGERISGQGLNHTQSDVLGGTPPSRRWGPVRLTTRTGRSSIRSSPARSGSRTALPSSRGGIRPGFPIARGSEGGATWRRVLTATIIAALVLTRLPATPASDAQIV